MNQPSREASVISLNTCSSKVTGRTAKAITESVESLGGYLNAFTSEENTCYYARASSRHFAALSDVLMDMAMNPTFLKEELTKEREVILEELAMIMDQPHQRVLEMLNEVCWPNHPLGRCITGTPETLVSMNAGRLRRFWGKHYHASNLLVAVAGPLEHRQVVRQLRPLARKLPSGIPPHEKAVRSRQRHPGLIHLRRSSEQYAGHWNPRPTLAMIPINMRCESSTPSLERT